jgi:catechol 2,3-dioxygenase-like lactoylglutathione lyase family enzyme
MILNHLNLAVTDVAAACDFLEKYFGLHKMGGNAGLTVMSDERGFVLTLMKAGKSSPQHYPDNFHIGFFVESEAKVDELNQRLLADGYDVQPPERHHAYGFYVEAPGGFSVEIGA